MNNFQRLVEDILLNYTSDPTFYGKSYPDLDYPEIIYVFKYLEQNLSCKFSLNGIFVYDEDDVIAEVTVGHKDGVAKTSFSTFMKGNIFDLFSSLNDCIKSKYDLFQNLKEKLSKKTVIYKITNKKTGMCYIGKTENHFLHRWKDHFRNPSFTKFHMAIKESSEIDWTFEVVEEIVYPEGITTVSEADKYVFSRENHWIKELDCIENGYNSK